MAEKSLPEEVQADKINTNAAMAKLEPISAHRFPSASTAYRRANRHLLKGLPNF
jgi:hypothetical protein